LQNTMQLESNFLEYFPYSLQINLRDFILS
jgi:hypothetical protein